MKEKNSFLNPFFFFKIGICLFPLVMLIIYGITKEGSSLINNFMPAFTRINIRLIFNSFLLLIAFTALLLCGFRVYGLFLKRFNSPAKTTNPLSLILISFILGFLVIFILLIALGVPGFYYTPVLWVAVLLIIFFPYRLKEFFVDIKSFISSIKIKWDMGFLLFVLAIVYFGIPLLLVQFSMPFPPCVDIMEVYVAPVTRVLTFHQYIPDNSMPAAYYNAFRAVPLHTGFYSFLASLTGLNAYEAITGSYFSILCIALLSVFYLARSLGNRLSGGVAVWLFSASVNYAHIIDARSGIYAMLFFLPAFAFCIRLILEKEKTQKLFLAICPGVAFGLITQMHPVVGAYVFICIFFIFVFVKIWISVNHFWEVGYAVMIGAFISLLFFFQLKTYLSMPLPQIFLILGGYIILMIPVFFFLRFVLKKNPGIGDYPRRVRSRGRGRLLLVPVILFLLVIHLVYIFKWVSPWHNEPPFLNLLKLTPFLFTIGLVSLARLAYVFFTRKDFPVSRYKTGATILLGTAVFAAFSLPMYIYPLFNLQGVLNMSFSMEIAGKGLDFFIIPLLVIFGALIIVGIKNRIIRYAIIPIIMFMVTLPTQGFLSEIFPYFSQTAQASIQGITEEQLDKTVNGFFGGWDGDRRLPLSGDNFLFIDHLKSLIADKQITMNDSIVHISVEQNPWQALPFPTFTGINQVLLLVNRNPDDIYTAFGKLYDFPESFDYSLPPKWLLVEKVLDFSAYNDFFTFVNNKYFVSYENKRILFFRRISD